MQDDSITIVLGLPELRVVGQEETETEINVEVTYRAESAVCPRCGRETAKVHSARPQPKRDGRIGKKLVFLILHKRRFRCLACGKVFSEPDPAFGARRRSSRRFRERLGQEAINQPIRQVAHKEGVGEGLVRRCLTEEAQRLLGVPDRTAPVTIMGLDEFSIRKGQVYDTAVMDIKSKQVLGVVTGHGQEEVGNFFDALPMPERVQVVVMDMHEPFRQAVELCLSEAKIVVDKFHVISHVNRALDQVRTALQPRCNRGKKGDLFRARYLLLRGKERLTPEGYLKLMRVLGDYPQLKRAWELKEALRRWYKISSRAEAERELAVWEATIKKRGPTPFKRLLTMFCRWRREILNYFDYPYTNGFVEGKNNRIKVIMRTAYGYRNNLNFRQRILLTNLKEVHPRAA